MKSEFYNEIKNNQDIDTFISNFMSIKKQIGNGVGAGKLFERIFVQFINKKTSFFSLSIFNKLVEGLNDYERNEN
jgi:hypothetical protein